MPKAYRALFSDKFHRKSENSFAWSQRLFLSRECVTSEDRRMMPVLIINVDGVLGYWDDQSRHYFVLRHKIIDSLINLSYDFRIVAVSSKKKKLICKLIYALMNIPFNAESISNFIFNQAAHTDKRDAGKQAKDTGN